MKYRPSQSKAEKQAEAQRMRELRQQGLTLLQIATRFRCSESAVCRILKGNRRKTVASSAAAQSPDLGVEG